MATYEPMPGSHIKEAVAEIAQLASSTGQTVEMEFNSIKVVAMPGDTDEQLLAYWRKAMAELNAESDRKRVEWEATPEGQAQMKQWADKRSAVEAELAEERACPGAMRPFITNDVDFWREQVEANTDSYGAGVLRYAARWAWRMENAITAGAKLEDVAQECSHKADIEGITGFMYGCAVSILAKCWKHGEALRRWHNIKTQVRNEGEKANESGGVLNPALLTIGG